MSKRSLAMVAGALALACGDAPKGEQTSNGAAVVSGAATLPPGTCFEAPGLEAAATRCGQGAVSQVGDTLVIRLAGQASVTRVNRIEDNDYRAVYRYVGRVGGIGGMALLHVVERMGWEESSVELINARTGAVALVRERPVMSPDGLRFAVGVDFGMGSWDRVAICSAPIEVTVWRMTDSIPLKEFVVDAFDCDTGRGWAPVAAVWRSADSITFQRMTLQSAKAARVGGIVDTTRGALVRTATGWALDGASKALVPIR